MSISRRSFLVSAAGAGVGLSLGAFSYEFPLAPPHVGPDWRPGQETFVPSTCLLCPAHCGIRARLVDGALTRIDGNPLHPVSQGGLCPKGRAGIQLAYHPGRLKGPVRRIGAAGSDRFEPISWDAALDEVASALRQARQAGESSSVEWLVGDAHGVMGDLIAAFAAAYGTARISVDDYRDGSSEVLRLCQGIDAAPAYDLASSDLVLSFGAALAESWSALPLAARARDASGRRDRRWIQADVRLSRTAVCADEWIPVRPGTYGALALGIAYLLAKEGLYDAEFVSSRVSGWEDWTDQHGQRHTGFRSLILKHGSPDDVSAVTGVPIARLMAVAKAFGTAERPVALWDHAVGWRRGGLSDALAIHALNILRGSLNRPGGVLVQAPIELPGPLDSSDGHAGLRKAALTSTTWPGDRDPARPPKILFLYQSNPVASSARPGDVRRALSSVPLVVSFSPFLDDSAKYANLVLPDHTYLERWQDAQAPATVAFPVWGVVRPVIEPLQNTRATGDVILSLAARLGGDVAPKLRWSSVEQLVRERGIALASARRGSAFVEAFRQDELRELEGRGWWLPHGESPDQYWQTILDTGGWFDPQHDYRDRSGVSQQADGRVWIFPADARTRLERTADERTDSFLPTVNPPAVSPASADRHTLRLVPYRVLTLASGGTPLMPWLLEHVGVLSGNAWEAWAELNPKTAAELNLRSGQRVRVESQYGAFDATVRVVAAAQPGVVNVPYGLHARVPGWGDAAGANPLVAVGGEVDAVTGLPDWYSTDVRLTAL